MHEPSTGSPRFVMRVTGLLTAAAVGALSCLACSCTPAAKSPNPAGVAGVDRASDAASAVRTTLHPLDERGFPSDLPKTVEEVKNHPFVPENAWEELDDIYGLMALAVVHADWQESKHGNKSIPSRGHNIGGIIVDKHFEVVNWERNSNEAMCNGTQHGEVRTMLKHLNLTGSNTLHDHQIYTSLEPCMMCSGMMMQQSVLRTVYMQTDNQFGKNIERLTIDSSKVPVRFDGEDTHRNGYGPAARPVISSMSDSEFRVELDTAYRAAGSEVFLTEWLTTDQAQDIYARARYKFEHYELRFPDQKAVAQFIVPAGANSGQKVKELRATKTNAELYRDALAFFNDPARGITPYARLNGSAELVEDKKNASATRLLEVPAAQKADVVLIDGMVNGTRVHQERIRRTCGRPKPTSVSASSASLTTP